MMVRILNMGEEFLYVEATKDNQPPSLVTVIYAPPLVTGLEKYWETITSFALKDSIPWIIVGDFNAITCLQERKGGSGRLRAHDLRFSNWIHKNGLVDVGFSGSPFTWARNTSHGGRVSKRLDSALCNNNW